MNIIEAVKSGKRIKRKGWPNKNCWAQRDGYRMYRILEEDLLADDWEVEEKQVTITESDFSAALARTNNSFSIYAGPNICEYLGQLKKELGL
jgi:hypothetical protein